MVDVLVVGAGPAGLSAAIAVAERGKRVLVLDQGLRPGGQIWRHRQLASLPPHARAMIERALALGVVIANDARVVDAISPNELVIAFRGRIDRQPTRALILATGARERLLPFPGWTLPGVVGVGGLQALIKSGVSLAGARVVICGTGPLLFPVAATAVAAGADLLLVAEQASRGAVLGFGTSLLAKPEALLQAAKYRAVFRKAPFHTGSWITAAEGFGHVQRAVVNVRGKSVTFDCDWVATSAGLVPSTELAQILGCTTVDGAVDVDDMQGTSVGGVWAIGECTGVKGDLAAITEGEIAGRAAVGDVDGARAGSLQRRRNRGRMFGRRLARAFAAREELLQLATDDTIICRCEDVRRRDVDPTWTQRQAKLWTRVGMGECQGAVCGTACTAMFGWAANVARPPLGAPTVGEWGEELRNTAP